MRVVRSRPPHPRWRAHARGAPLLTVLATILKILGFSRLRCQPRRVDLGVVFLVSTEDKAWWVEEWRGAEFDFVDRVAPALGLDAVINPAKASDPFAADLVVDGRVADLKCQRAPFFRAGELYGLDPRWSVTFNRKDFLRYERLYPDLVLFFWVAWLQSSLVLRGRVLSVAPIAGVWRVEFSDLADRIRSGGVPLHSYQRRVDDLSGNAKDSYLFDLRGFDQLSFRELAVA